MEIKFREKISASGAKVLLGKDAENNDKLVKKFKGEDNIIIHTVAPGSPFCVINKANPSKKDIHASGAACVAYSQDWRDNKKDTKVHVFTGKDVEKKGKMKIGTWRLKNKPEEMTIKKKDVEKTLKKWKE